MPLTTPPRAAMPEHLVRFRQALNDAGVGEPSLLVDLDCLDYNMAALRRQLPDGMSVRLVQKSLPSAALLGYVAYRLGCDRLMVFHRPWVNQYAQQINTANACVWSCVMLGKPMPVAAAQHFYTQVLPGSMPQPHWLIDTLPRLQQYLSLAVALNQRLNVCLEVDVGLHRGGLARPEDMRPLLALIQAHPFHLHLTGLMGYDAHAAKAPWWTSPEQAMRRVCQRYEAFVREIREHFPALWHDQMLLNGGGSPTLSLHPPDSPVNDLALGSALLKPTDFDIPSLQSFRSALWLAVPVLKVHDGVSLPFVSPLSKWVAKYLFGGLQSIGLYGGRFWAKPVWPPGLRALPLVGQSSNQALMCVSSSVDIQPDDWTFWRPTQSEQVLLQHGDVLGIRGDRITERFPVDLMALMG